MPATAPPFAATDALAETLQYLRMEGSYYCRSEFTAPWGLELPPTEHCLWFHVVTSGRCTLEVDGADAVELNPGDLALVPHGEGHRLRGEPEAHAPSIHDLEIERVGDSYDILRHGGGGSRTMMVCGAVTFNHPAAENLIRILPKVIHVEANVAPESGSIRNTVALMASEVESLRPGSESVVTRLSDILVIQAIRSWIENDPAAEHGWIAALQDRQVGHAISLIHRDPAADWSVESLAKEVAMSRSAFAARFTALAGEPVMQYVARWRMSIALNALRDEKASVAELADRLGYQSEASFSRAFKRVIGIPPGAARKLERPVEFA